MLLAVFDRFTAHARLVVVRAQEHARDLAHGYVGTEHLLLAVVGDGGAIPTLVLASFGVDQEKVRASVLEIVGIGAERSGGFLSFTPAAKESMEMAMSESLALGHGDVRPGHLLLGLMGAETGVAVRVLLDLKVPLDDLRAALLERLGDPGTEEPVRPPVTTRGPQLIRPVSTAGVRAATDARQADADHQGPPDRYVVTRAVEPAEASDDVRAVAESALSQFCDSASEASR